MCDHGCICQAYVHDVRNITYVMSGISMGGRQHAGKTEADAYTIVVNLTTRWHCAYFQPGIQ